MSTHDRPRNRGRHSPVRSSGWLAMLLLLLSALIPAATAAANGDPVVTQETGVAGCMGVRTTPGSENTDKRLIGGTLQPGGTAVFEISYPVDPSDVAGRTTFVITDCVFIDGEPVLKYSVSFVPNTENFILSITLDIPEDAPLGSEYCNFAKTTAAPSESQASNRKAGPACFIVGGALRVEKVSGSESGPGLAGAVFDVSCKLPTTNSFLSDTIINVQGHAPYTFDSHSGATINQTVTTGSDGIISVQAPAGTVCTFTETSPPSGFTAPGDNDCELTVPPSDQATCTLVNQPVATPTPTPTPTPSPSGGVAAETETPTLPPTDTWLEGTWLSDPGWQAALALLAGIIAFVLVLTPRRIVRRDR